MICWSCEHDAGEGLTCLACGALQPPDEGADHFRVLGCERRYDLDLAALEARYKDLSRKVHPDRFATADPRARRASLRWSVRVNEAWRTLRDPVRRAEYLLSLAGIDVGTEEGTVRRDGQGGRARVPVPQELLVEALELRTALAEARAAGDDARVGVLAAEVRGRVERGLAAVAAGLAPGGDLDAAARELVAQRYWRRFLDEVAAHEEGGALPVFGAGGGKREARS